MMKPIGKAGLSWALCLVTVFLMLGACSGGDGNNDNDVTNTAPVADAGTDQKQKVDTEVTLDGGGSSDADGNQLTYSWTLIDQPVDSSTTLSGETTATPSFTPDVGGIYEVSLTVNDGTADSAADSVVITVGVLLPDY